MVNPLEHPDFNDHELIAFKQDKATGLQAIIALHDTTLGPALGGCRMYPYVSADTALGDVLRLSRGMSYKSALADLPLGGGKAVIMGDPARAKTRPLLLAMADFVDSLNGQYITAEDSGTDENDMAVMAEHTRFVSGLVNNDQTGGDPSPTTAYGVLQGIRAAVACQLRSDLHGVRVAVQGVGKVGFQLARLLMNAGAEVMVADISCHRVEQAVDRLGVTAVSLDRIMGADVDVLAPCALGTAINERTVPLIKASVIAGAANNQLASAEIGEQLAQRGILYAPDYVINAGGVIDIYYQLRQMADRRRVMQHVEKIGDTLAIIFEQAAATGQSTARIADAMAVERLCQQGSRSRAA